MSKKTTTRPLEFNGTKIVLGMKLYSVSQLDVCKYSSGKSFIKPWTGQTTAKIEEYIVVWLNEAENSRSFKVKSSKGCEEHFTFRYCDRTLEAMNFSVTFDGAVKKAIELEKAHITKAEKSIDNSIKKVAEIRKEIARKKKGLSLLKKNIAKMPKTLKVCKSC